MDNIAPWNESGNKKEIEVTISTTISKTFKLEVDEEYNLEDEVKKQLVLPHQLADYLLFTVAGNSYLRNVKYPNNIKEAIRECSDWNVDDYVCINE